MKAEMMFFSCPNCGAQFANSYSPEVTAVLEAVRKWADAPFSDECQPEDTKLLEALWAYEEMEQSNAT